MKPYRRLVITLAIYLIMLTGDVVAQPRVIEGEKRTPFDPVGAVLSAEPFLLVKTIKYQDARIDFGERMKDPDWLAEAEFEVQNVSSFNVKSAVLMIWILDDVGPRSFMEIARWECCKKSDQEGIDNKEKASAAEPKKPISPGAIRVIKATVTRATLRRFRERVAQQRFQPERAILVWKAFETTQGIAWWMGAAYPQTQQ